MFLEVYRKAKNDPKLKNNILKLIKSINMNSIIINVKKTSIFIFALSIVGVALSLLGCGDDNLDRQDLACDGMMLELPIGFDCTDIDYSTKITGDVSFTVIDNPELSGVNSTASKVGVITNVGVVWEHALFNLDNPVDFSKDRGFTLKLYSTQALPIKLKFEDGTSANVEADANHGGTGWEKLTFNLAASGTYNDMVIFVDGPGTSVGTFYVDDIVQVAGGSGTYSLDEPIDFEPSGYGAAWTWNVFENDSNPALEFVANPDATGENTSANVAKFTALTTGAPWIGTETAHGEMGITWDLSASNAIIKIMVYKSVISNVGIKLVNAAGGAQVEIKVANTKINEWEELTFDFSSRIGNGLDGSTNIDQIVVFPDFRDPRTSEQVVYFDNIIFTAK